MDYPKFIESNQKEESICIQRGNYTLWSGGMSYTSLQLVTESSLVIVP